MSRQLSFGTADVVVTLTPEKPRPGSKPMTVRVYARFGRVKERTVQEICDVVGGDAVYFEFKTPHGTHLMPVVAWKRPAFAGNADNIGLLVRAAEALRLAVHNDWTIVVYGSARRRWLVSFNMIWASAAHDALDMEPDSNGAPRAVSSPTASNRMREEF